MDPEPLLMGHGWPSTAVCSSLSVPGAAVRDRQVLQLGPGGDLLQPATALHVTQHRRGQGEHEPACGSHRTTFQVRDSPLGRGALTSGCPYWSLFTEADPPFETSGKGPDMRRKGRV